MIRSHQDSHRTYQVATATASMRSGGMATMPALQGLSACPVLHGLATDPRSQRLVSQPPASDGKVAMLVHIVPAWALGLRLRCRGQPPTCAWCGTSCTSCSQGWTSCCASPMRGAQAMALRPWGLGWPWRSPNTCRWVCPSIYKRCSSSEGLALDGAKAMVGNGRVISSEQGTVCHSSWEVTQLKAAPEVT